MTPTSAEPARSSRPRHSADTPSVRRLTIGLALGSGLLAAATSSAAPTGVEWVDRCEVGLVVATVALAASRARRWTLITGASVAALLTPLPLWPLAVAALVLSVGLFQRNLRDRVAGTAVGGLVGVCASDFVHLGWLGPVIVASVFATIFFSGFRRTSRANRRRVRRTAQLLLAVGVVLLAATGITAVTARGDLQVAARSTSAGAAATRNGEDVEATKQFVEAARAFDAVSGRLAKPWVEATKLIPGVAQNLTAVGTATREGSRVSASAAALMNGLDYSSVQRKEGGVDTAKLAEFAPDAARLASTMGSASTSVASASSPLLAPPVADRLDEMSSELTKMAAQTNTAALATQLLPGILGADFGRRYLVIFANPAESRDLGGILASWAILSAEGGHLDVTESGSPIDLFGPLDERMSIDDPGRLAPSFLDMAPQQWPQNWTSTIDLQAVARVASDLMIDSGRAPVDGVLYLDPYALQAFVSLSGPVKIPGFDIELNSENTADFFLRDQYSKLPQNPEVDRALSDLVDEVLGRLTARSLPGPQALGDLFSPLVRDGHLRFQTTREQDGALIDRLGLGGFDPAADRGDTFGVLVRNVAPNKLDPFVQRSATYNVTWDPETRRVRATATLSFANLATVDGANPIVVGNESGFAPGTAILRVGVLTPFKNARFSVGNGRDLAVVSTMEFGSGAVGQPPIYRNTFDLHLAAGQRLEVAVDLGGTLEVDSYSLLVLGQASGTGDGRVVAKLTTSRGTSGEISCLGGQICRILPLPA